MNPSLPYSTSTPPIATQEDEDVNFGSYLATVFDNRRLILTIAFVVGLLGTGYAFLAKPVYEANMLIHVEEDSPKEANNILGEMGSLFEYKTAATAEIELLRSRLVVSRAIDNLRLYVNVRPKYFPVIGAWLASRNKGLSTPGLLGYGGYAWGAEKIDVPVFNVADALQNLEFVVTVENDGQYRLRQSDENIDLKGRVGIPINAKTEKGGVELKIDQIFAKPGTKFFLTRASRLSTIEDVQASMAIAEQGKQSGIISTSLQGDDPKVTASILNEVGKEYVRQNTGRKTEEAEKSLAFLNKRLPELRQELEQSEAKLNQFRNSHGTIDLGEEAKLSLQQSSAAKLRKIELQQKRTELLGRFMPEHPIVKGVDSQIAAINGEIKEVADHIKTLPLLEQDILRLNRDVKVNTDLYTALLNTAQQLRMITVGKGSNVRLVDTPMAPEKPISPNRPKVIAIANLAGLLLGLMAAFIKKAFRGAIDDPQEIEKMLGVPVYASIPHSKMQKELLEEASGKTTKLPVLARVSSTDIAIESLRNFRAALQFSLSQSKNNIVVIAGPTSGMGKTFVSVNLAAIMAASGKRVLLIDADFRNGHLHRYFDLERQNGLSDYISGASQMPQIVHRDVIENMDFISTGGLPPNPSELLLRPNLGTLLQSLSATYDLVLIDATPILPVADTLIIGAHASSIYIITRAGVTTPGEISESFKRLHQVGLAPKGVLFNDMAVKPGRYGYGYTYGKYRQVQYLLDEHPRIETSQA